MQTSILSVLLALGLPGANSCSAQQQGLPRVGQNPPAATQGEEPKPAVAEKEDADDEDVDEPKEMEEMDADEAQGADEPLAEIAEIQAEQGACKSHCEGSGSSETQSSPLLGNLFGSRQHPQTLALGGQVAHVDENDLDGNVQRVTIEPGSTVIVKCKNGEQVVLRAQGADSLQSTSGDDMIPLMSLGGLGYTMQAAPQKNDERVRELEKRVRELEAQLRERDGQAARTPEPFSNWSNQAQAGARDKALEEQRAQMREMHQRMSAQAREQAAQARKQAEDVRRQVEVYQKQALEQQKLWRADAQGGQGNGVYTWSVPKAAKAPKPPKAPRAPTPAPEATPAVPGMPSDAAPEVSPTPGMAAPRAHALRTPQPPRAANGPGGEHVQELQSMLNDMRRQMDEMREQMQALRQELERAPQREMR